MELFDFADVRLGTQVGCEYPSITGYEVGNLIHKQYDTRALPGDAAHAQMSLLDARPGFMAESFVKPPVEITFRLEFPVSLAAVVVNPRVRMHLAKHASIFVMRDDGQRWEFVSRLEWADGHGTQLAGTHNQELDAQAVARVVMARGSECTNRPTDWAPMDRAPASLHMVTAVKLRVGAMHHSSALGIGGIELWAQPSQRLPRAQKDRAWHYARQAVSAPGANQLTPEGQHADPLEQLPPDCPPEFIDTITQSLMRDPVALPSKVRCDRSTINRHLLAHSTDPFTGLPLDSSQVKPDLVLQQRIRSWLESRVQPGQPAAAAPGRPPLE